MEKKKRNSIRYRISIINENSLDTVFSKRLNRLGFYGVLGGLLVLMFLFSYFILFVTPIRHHLPGYLDPKLRQQMVNQAFLLDSLSDEVSKQDNFIQLLKVMMTGDYEIDMDTDLDSLAVSQAAVNMEVSQAELDFRARYEESERYNLSAIAQPVSTDGLLFYVPFQGEIVTHYSDRDRHYGLDIKSAGRQSVLCVLDGTVTFAGYTPDYEYVVCVQHTNDFLSVYRQASELLVHEGSAVKAGEALAFIVPDEESARLPHLHFELWYRGHPLNPEDYILFHHD